MNKVSCFRFCPPTPPPPPRDIQLRSKPNCYYLSSAFNCASETGGSVRNIYRTANWPISAVRHVQYRQRKIKAAMWYNNLFIVNSEVYVNVWWSFKYFQMICGGWSTPLYLEYCSSWFFWWRLYYAVWNAEEVRKVKGKWHVYWYCIDKIKHWSQVPGGAYMVMIMFENCLQGIQLLHRSNSKYTMKMKHRLDNNHYYNHNLRPWRSSY